MNWKYIISELPFIGDVVLVCFDINTQNKEFQYGIGVRKEVNRQGDWRWHNAVTGDTFSEDVEWWCHLENPNY